MSLYTFALPQTDFLNSPLSKRLSSPNKITYLSVTLNGKLYDVPLADFDYIKSIVGDISLIMPIDMEDFSSLDITFYSELTDKYLHDYKPGYKFYLIHIKNGSAVITYGIMDGNILRF